MSEKLASAEIAESRKRFEKEFSGKGISFKKRADGEYEYDSTSNMFLGWLAAERDTRERCAQIVKEEADHYQAIEWFETARSFRRVAERIRGVNR